MDISWGNDIKYNNDINKKFMMNTTTNKNNIIFNQNNNINNTDISNISNNKKEIYLKKSGNTLIDTKNNDNYQSYHILYINNPNKNFNTSKQKLRSTKIINNYYQSNPANMNKNNKKNERELSLNNNYKNNVKLINDFNKKIPDINIDNNTNNNYKLYNKYSKNKERTNINEINNNINKNNNFLNNNSVYITSQNQDKNNIFLNNIYENIKTSKNDNNQYNTYLNNNNINNNKIKNKINFQIPKKNSRRISGSSSQQNIITNNKNLIKTEENFDNNISGYLNNLNNINISNRNNYAFYISPNRFTNNSINNKNKSNKKERIKYTYKTSLFDNNNQNNINPNNESDFINNNNYSNINIDLYENNNSSMNNNNYINLYLMNNVNNNNINNNNSNKLLYSQNIPKNNINGNYYMLAQNNKLTESNELIKNIKVNTMTRNNLLTERNNTNTNDIKKNNTNKSLENSDCFINIKIKNNKNNINKLINNKFTKSKIYIKKIDTKNNKPLMYQKDNKNIIENKSPTKNKNVNKKKVKLKNQNKNQSKNNILLEKPRNKNNFKKKYYCYNLKLYENKKCFFGKSYITKNPLNKNNNLEESHEITFAEKIPTLIDNNNMNTISINNEKINQIDDNLLIENSFKNNNPPQNELNPSSKIIQSYSNTKIPQKNKKEFPNPKKNVHKMKKNFEKISKQINNNINYLDKEDLEMTFGIEEIKNVNKKENIFEEADLYQNDDIQIMTDEEEENIKEKNEMRITYGKEISNFPYKINKGLELLEKIQEKRKSKKIEINLDNSDDKNDKDKDDINDKDNNKELLFDSNFDFDNYYKKTNTLKPKDTRMILRNLTKNKKCEILNEVLTDLFEKKERESKIFDTNVKQLNYNPQKIETYEKIFNQEKIQNLESILNKKRMDKMFDFINDKEINEIKSKKSIMTYNKKHSKNITTKILEESNSEENSINNENDDIKQNNNKIIFSYQDIININNTNELCKKDNLLSQEFIEHCNDLLNNYEIDIKKGNLSNNNNINENIINNNTEIEKWSRKDITPEIKKAEEYMLNMTKEMSKNNFKYEIIEILNTITVDNYDDILIKLNNIVYQLNNIKNIKPEILLDNQFRFSEIIIEKAIMEKGYVKLYAKICYDLFKTFNTLKKENPNIFLNDSENLQTLLITECKQIFNDYQYNKDINEENFLIKKKFLGNINFICELIDVKLFTQKIGFDFLDSLFKNYEKNLDENKNLNLEGIITLLNKFGKIVFEEKNEKFLEDLNYYMKECITPIIQTDNNNNKNIPDYLKYKIINLIEKQKNNWEESMFEKSITAKGKLNEI